MIDLAILASANGTNAQAIIDATKCGKLKANVRVVLTNKPEAGVIEKAKKAGIPVEIIPSRGYKNRREEYNTLVVEALRKYNVDTIALAGWMRILSSVFIDAYGGRIINLHPAILPSFKGHKGIEDAYAYGVKVTGCSVHLASRADSILPTFSLIFAPSKSISYKRTLPPISSSFARSFMRLCAHAREPPPMYAICTFLKSFTCCSIPKKSPWLVINFID